VSDLASRKCEACESGTPSLGPNRAAELHSQLNPDWVLHADKIEREFKFRNFTEAFGTATKVALLAENQGHHPDFEIGWGRLGLTLTTHAVKGLSENDFIMAAKIDQF
jgi:4a-hydroxytetrahydrobiopterin dehydratase